MHSLSSFDFKQARENMVENQLRPAEVNHRLLIEIMRVLPRENCLISPYSELAYSDVSLPLSNNRWLSEPRIIVRMLQLADLKPQEKVLLIGGATGYVASIIALLGANIVSVESDLELLQIGQEFTKLNAPQVIWHQGKLLDGCIEQANYDVIIIDGAVPDIPNSLSKQLQPGGHIVTVLHEDGSAPTAVCIEKKDENLVKINSFYADLPILTEFL